MTIFLIHGKPHTAVLDGFQLIDYLTYQTMIESGEMDEMEVIEL